jgi:hypothetical protein
MKRRKDYDPREETLQDMGEKNKDYYQEDDLRVKENRIPLIIFAGTLIVVLGIFIVFRLI